MATQKKYDGKGVLCVGNEFKVMEIKFDEVKKVERRG